MKILMIHGQYATRGGEDESSELEVALLRANEHDVLYLNDKIGNADGFFKKIILGFNAIFNVEWFVKTWFLCAKHQFDLVHCQNLFPAISYSVYLGARIAGVPVIQAVRNYRIVCPSALLFRNGRVCTDCVGKTLKLECVKYKCYKSKRLESFGALFACWTSMFFRKTGVGPTKYIAVSEYVKNKLIEDGVNEKKIITKPNFSDFRSMPTDENDLMNLSEDDNFGDYVLFVGRVCKEKGSDTLIEAFEKTNRNVKLLIVGEGVGRDGHVPNVLSLGRKKRNEVYKIMQKAKAVIVPGIWAEPFGRVVVEAFCCGVPVITSGLGGVRELVQDGVNGLIYDINDEKTLIVAIQKIIDDEEFRLSLCKGALKSYYERFTAAENYRQLVSAYHSVCNRIE